MARRRSPGDGRRQLSIPMTENRWTRPSSVFSSDGISKLTYEILRLLHIIGLSLIAGGLIGVFISDLRSRQLVELAPFAEAIRNIAIFYDGVVVPGALLLLFSGTWLIVEFHGGWGFLETPWLVGMVLLFAFEFIEGNTITRLYFVRLRRLTREAVGKGGVTPELLEAREHELLPTFTHFLDLPLLLVIVSLGVIRPDTWTQAILGVGVSVLLAAALTVLLPRLYPWTPERPTRD
jgi:uncharacterized membrane protein